MGRGAFPLLARLLSSAQYRRGTSLRWPCESYRSRPTLVLPPAPAGIRACDRARSRLRAQAGEVSPRAVGERGREPFLIVSDSAAPALDKVWLHRVQEGTCGVVKRLRTPGPPGHYRPCERGVTAIGLEMGLGFSCFALRTLRMFGAWEELPPEKRQKWGDFLCRFQQADGEGAFRDEPEMRYISRERSLPERAWDRLRRRPALPSARALLSLVASNSEVER